MFFVTLAATLMLAGADQAQPAPAETAAAPAPAAAVAVAPKPKTRRVCYVDEAATGSHMQKRRCVTEVVDEKPKAAEAK